jgi:hypothetical protein
MVISGFVLILITLALNVFGASVYDNKASSILKSHFVL